MKLVFFFRETIHVRLVYLTGLFVSKVSVTITVSASNKAIIRSSFVLFILCIFLILSMAHAVVIRPKLARAEIGSQQNKKEDKQMPIKALIIDNHSNYIQEVIDILADYGIRCSVIDYADFILDESKSFDFFILSGGGINIRTNASLDQEMELVRQTPKPIFGICAGFQIIATVYAKYPSKTPVLEKLQEKVHGVKKIKLFNLSELGINYPDNELDVFESHGWAIKTPIDDFTVFGSSEYGTEIIKHNSKPILATQFHPEVQENNKGIIFFKYFIEKMILDK
jgi:GMP synthase-like glutamine amidotransferase